MAMAMRVTRKNECVSTELLGPEELEINCSKVLTGLVGIDP